MQILWLSLVLAISWAAPAQAWGAYGHKLTARLAWSGLKPGVRAELRQLMRAQAQLETPECPAASLEDLSYWPDCVRRLAPRFSYADRWHYQNINICQPFDIAQKCDDGQCVTGQIPVQLDIFSDRRRPVRERLLALAYFVHLVGDLHQPLHIGEKNDRGGNQVRASYGVKMGLFINLHGIWDTELAERALTEPPAIKAGRSGASVGAISPDAVPDKISLWAKESWTISRELAYPLLGPDGALCPLTPDRSFMIDEAYVKAAAPVLRAQVQKAGSRMAMLLNGALAR
jgi:hypothetical protein